MLFLCFVLSLPDYLVMVFQSGVTTSASQSVNKIKESSWKWDITLTGFLHTSYTFRHTVENERWSLVIS